MDRADTIDILSYDSMTLKTPADSFQKLKKGAWFPPAIFAFVFAAILANTPLNLIQSRPNPVAIRIRLAAHAAVIYAIPAD